MKYNPSPRTYGVKLMESNANRPNVESPVTTRMCDVELLKSTGEIEYLDEEGTTMPNPNATENANRMRAEITSVEQFKAIGSYSEVAKKYMISKSTAHGHMMHLKSIADKPSQVPALEQGPSPEEIEQFYTDAEPRDIPDVELEPEYNLEIDDEHNELECEKDNIRETNASPIELSNEALHRLLMDLEAQWKKPELDENIEKLKNSITTGITALHKMCIYRAEMEFQEWIMEVIEEC